MNITIDNLSLYYDVHGAGDPIVFLHGFPLSGKLWEPMVPALRREYRLIIPDLRGHGRSQASTTVTMARFADDLASLLASIGETRAVVLVGMSMGGYISFECLRRHPARVRALVLTNTRAQADSPEDARMRREMSRRVSREGSAVVARAMIPKLFGPQAPNDLRARWREILAATEPVGVIAALEALAVRPDSFATLASMSCPALIVAGENDAITPPEDARRMKQAARTSRLEVLAGAGHMAPVERPELFLAALRSFVDELPRQDRR